MRLPFLALLIAGIACSASSTEPAPEANGMVTIRFGQTANLSGTRVTFTDIADSRCPKDVTCVWAGDAAVRLESGEEHLVLHTAQAAGPATGRLAGVTLTLVEVKPERLSASNEPAKSEYVISLRVDQ